MKNIIFAATAMIVAMTAVSCSKVAGIEENPSYTYRFAVVNEELPSVKSDMSDDYKGIVIINGKKYLRK